MHAFIATQFHLKQRKHHPEAHHRISVGAGHRHAPYRRFPQKGADKKQSYRHKT